jgi:Methylamine utilisation protein MauE
VPVPVLTAVVGAAALLLLAAGAAKVADPSRTAGALAAVAGAIRGRPTPVAPAAVRAGALAEAALGAATLVVGGRALSALVGLSYAGFAAFVAAARRTGAPVGTCGCFGRPDTPPRPLHVAVDAVFAGAGVTGAVAGLDPLLSASPAAIVAAVVVAGVGYTALTSRARHSSPD